MISGAMKAFADFVHAGHFPVAMTLLVSALSPRMIP